MCEHDFEIISKDILPSPYEQEFNVELKADVPWKSYPSWYYQKKIVIILKCTKCPKIKKIIETNP